MSHIFLSYARRDGLSHVERLENGLGQQGYHIWRDKRDIDPSRDFTAEIEKAIEAASHVVVCITPDVKREDSFVRRELQYALTLNKPIYVARFDHTTLPPLYVINHAYVDFADNDKWDAALGKLCGYLDIAPTNYQPPPRPVDTDDSFRGYVGKLYQRTVEYLDRNIIRLIDLDVADTSEAVPARQQDIFGLLVSNDHTRFPFANFAEAFAHFNQRMLLLGEPGAGKTITLMSAMRDAAASRLSDPSAPLPIFGLLALWDSAKESSLAEWLGTSDKLLTTEAVRRVMEDGKALLLLDGLDELGSARTEKRMDGSETRYDPRQRFLKTFNEQLGVNRTLVTCRLADYAAIGNRAALEGAVTLQKLTDSQLRDYMKDLPALLNAIETDSGFNYIARTPMLLSFFAFAFRDRPNDLKGLEDLHEGALRDAIFNAYIEKRYVHEERRLKWLGEKSPFTLQEIKDVLGRLAMENASGQERHRSLNDHHVDNVLQAHDFELVVGHERGSKFIDFCLRLQYIQRRDDGKYGFIHILLRDALVYSFSLAHLRDESLYKDKSEPNPAMALGAIQDQRVLQPLLGLAQDTHVAILLRECAFNGLSRLSDPRTLEPLIQALADPNKDIRSNVAISLGQLGDTRAVQPLIRALNDVDADVQVSSNEALKLIGTPEALAAVEAWRARDGDKR